MSFYEELKRYWIFLTGGMFGRRLFCAAKMPERSGFFPGFLLKTKNKMKDRTKRKRKTGEKADVKAKAESSVNESGRIPRLVICGWRTRFGCGYETQGKMPGFEVTVLEDRPRIRRSCKKTGADNVICAPFKERTCKDRR